MGMKFLNYTFNTEHSLKIEYNVLTNTIVHQQIDPVYYFRALSRDWIEEPSFMNLIWSTWKK